MLNIVVVVGLIITILTAIPVALQLRNHPKGLYVCFFAEMWERFSYYGMRALLIYFLTQHFLFTDDNANQQYASYTTLIYLMPLVGGVVADRWLGTRKAIIFGAILLVLGHFGMAFEGAPAVQTLSYNGKVYDFASVGRESARTVKLKIGNAAYAFVPAKDGGLDIQDIPANASLPAHLPAGSFIKGVKKITPWGENVFYAAISLIILGVGFMKPNISTIVGQLYGDRDPRRDAGFQLYYYGINLGSFWAAIVCGALGQYVGWWAGFGLAGLGMLAGLLCFVLGKGWLEGRGAAPEAATLDRKFGGWVPKEVLIYGLAAAALGIIYLLVQKNALVGYALGVGAIIVLSYVAFNMATRFNRIENLRLGLAMILSVSSIAFFTLFEQAGSSLNLFAARSTDLDLIATPIKFDFLGLKFVLASAAQLAGVGPAADGRVWIDMGLTPAQTQGIGSGVILIFAPLFSAVFVWLAKRGKDPDPVKKFSFALVNAGLGFLVLVWAARFANSAFQVPLIFLILTYTLHTWGELALSPVGLAQQTKLSPPLLASTMMATWFLGTSGAQYLAGFIARSASTETVGGQVLDASAALMTSLRTFNVIGWWGLGLGAVLFVLSFFVKGWAHGANDSDASSKH